MPKLKEMFYEVLNMKATFRDRKFTLSYLDTERSHAVFFAHIPTCQDAEASQQLRLDKATPITTTTITTTTIIMTIMEHIISACPVLAKEQYIK
jgi:hypothetical protein